MWVLWGRGDRLVGCLMQRVKWSVRPGPGKWGQESSGGFFQGVEWKKRMSGGWFACRAMMV